MASFLLDQPAGLHPDVALLIASLNDSTREWLDNFESIPDERMLWQPFAQGPSIAALMAHLIGAEDRWIRGIVFGEDAKEGLDDILAYNMALDIDSYVFGEPPFKPFAEYLDQLRVRREAWVQRLIGLTPKQVFRSARGNEFSLEWILAHLVQHDAYHGGQIVMLNELALRAS
jgi:uncharacterized damage-inducible protein DinB